MDRRQMTAQYHQYQHDALASLAKFDQVIQSRRVLPIPEQREQTYQARAHLAQGTSKLEDSLALRGQVADEFYGGTRDAGHAHWERKMWKKVDGYDELNYKYMMEAIDLYTPQECQQMHINSGEWRQFQENMEQEKAMLRQQEALNPHMTPIEEPSQQNHTPGDFIPGQFFPAHSQQLHQDHSWSNFTSEGERAYISFTLPSQQQEQAGPRINFESYVPNSGSYN